MINLKSVTKECFVLKCKTEFKKKNEPNSIFSLCHIYYYQKEYKKSKKNLKLFLSLKNDEDKMNHNIGIIYEMLGIIYFDEKKYYKSKRNLKLAFEIYKQKELCEKIYLSLRDYFLTFFIYNNKKQ